MTTSEQWAGGSSLTATSMRLLLSAVCREHFNFSLSAHVIVALPRPGAPPSCSPPPPLDWVTCTLQLLLSPTPSLFLHPLDFRRQTLGDSKIRVVNAATLFCFFYFSRFSDSNVSRVLSTRLLRNFHRAEQPQAGMAGWCCSCCFGHINQHPTHKATLWVYFCLTVPLSLLRFFFVFSSAHVCFPSVL